MSYDARTRALNQLGEAPLRQGTLHSERGDKPRCGSRVLLPSLLEISQIRRWLVLARGHEQAITADEVVLRADLNMCVALARKFRPNWLRVGVAQILLVNRPWPRERVIYHGDLVMKYVSVFLVEINALFEDGLIVVVQW
jgi:hypothetical protein